MKNMDFYGVDIHTVVVRNTPFIDLLFSEITAVLKFDILPIQNLFTFNKCNKSCSCLVIASKFPFVFTLLGGKQNGVPVGFDTSWYFVHQGQREEDNFCVVSRKINSLLTLYACCVIFQGCEMSS